MHDSKEVEAVFQGAGPSVGQLRQVSPRHPAPFLLQRHQRGRPHAAVEVGMQLDLRQLLAEGQLLRREQRARRGRSCRDYCSCHACSPSGAWVGVVLAGPVFYSWWPAQAGGRPPPTPKNARACRDADGSGSPVQSVSSKHCRSKPDFEGLALLVQTQVFSILDHEVSCNSLRLQQRSPCSAVRAHAK